MDRPGRALFYWGKDFLDRGDRSLIGPYLCDLSKRLRDDPTPEECEAAAKVFDRIVTKGSKAWAACGFVANHRPTTFRTQYRIWVEVRELVIFHNTPRGKAYARIATRYGLSVSRVKAVFLKLERSSQRQCAGDSRDKTT